MTREEARLLAESIQQWDSVAEAAIATPWYINAEDEGGRYLVLTLADGRRLKVTALGDSE